MDSSVLYGINMPPAEICDNGIDDDEDGLYDLNDPECDCNNVETTSLIPNPSFEEFVCCPDDKSQITCAETWIQASGPTSDYIHKCGWSGWSLYPPPEPFPDGEAILGFRDGTQTPFLPKELNWKEYAGACLLSPMAANEKYKIEFDIGFLDPTTSPPLNITIFGTPSCNYLPFGNFDVEVGCPTNTSEWIELGNIYVSGGDGKVWKNASIEFTPLINIEAIAIGPPCEPTTVDISTYYFFDNLILRSIENFQYDVTEEANACRPDFALSVTESSMFNYQWYKDGIALVGESMPRLENLYGTGSYQVRMTNGTTCLLSSKYTFESPYILEEVDVNICVGDVFPFGDLLLDESGHYIDTIELSSICDSIVHLNLMVNNHTEGSGTVQIWYDEYYEIGDTLVNKEGINELTLVSSVGCDSLLSLTIDYFDIFFANIFSPNHDGVNDIFTWQGDLSQLKIGEIFIYDRYGNLIYEGQEWNGYFNGDLAAPGVYICKARLFMIDGSEKDLYTDVTLVR